MDRKMSTDGSWKAIGN